MIWRSAILIAIMVSTAGTQPLAAQATAAPERTRLFTPDELRSDFRALYAMLTEAHRDLYVNVSKSEYDRLFREMLASIDRPEDANQAAVRFQRFVGFGRIAHARIDSALNAFQAYRGNGGKYFPITIRVRHGRAYVVQNLSGNDGIIGGDEILAIAGKPAERWLADALHELSTDSPYMANTLLEFRLPFFLWLKLGPVESFTLTLKRGDKNFETVVPARQRSEILAAAQTQPPLLDLDWDERTFRIHPDGTAYLRPGPFYNNVAGAADMYDDRIYAPFIEKAFETMVAAGVKRLLIDLRDNPGGDNSFSDRMVAWFATRPFRFASAIRMKVSPHAIASNERRIQAAGPRPDKGSQALQRAYAGKRNGEIIDSPVELTPPREGARFTGKVHVLVNRHSYSNSAIVAALVQDYRFGTIVGEETSDLATTLGGLETFKLPITGIEVSFPKSLIVRPSGSTERRGVVPDIPIETPLLETADDPVLKRALEIVREDQRTQASSQ